MEFWDAVRACVRARNTKLEAVAEASGISLNTMNGWIAKRRLPRADEAATIARFLETTVERLLSSDEASGAGCAREQASEYCPGNHGEVQLIPILNQKVAAGHGQELLDTIDTVGKLPFLRRMLRGSDVKEARAVEVRGDSMTGIQLFDGDLVVFVPGSIRGDGIYVLRVGGSLIVKRVEFDEVSRKLRIMSENQRYPDRIESADGQTVEVVGKVYGWVHSHPY